jgi:6-phosphogluconolactonase
LHFAIFDLQSIPMRIAHCILATFVISSIANAGPVVYVSVSGENRIDVYSIDANTGLLTRTSQHDVNGSPGALVYCAPKQMLYAALRPEGRIVAFKVEPGGALKYLSSHDVKVDPAHLSTDLAGMFLLAAYYPSGEVSVHKIDTDGRLAIIGKWTDTAANAHAVVVHPRTNAFVLVPHTSADRIFQFRFNPVNGDLSPCVPAYRLTQDHTGPRHLVFHPAIERAYTSNEQGGSVSAYKFDILKGDLTLLDTWATLPEGFQGDNACAEIRIRPGAKHLYVSNRGHDSLAGFEIEPTEGKLKPLGQTPTEQTPRSFDIDPSGKFLYAAGESSNRLSAYKIDDATGRLDRFATYDAGQAPWWVMSINSP